MDPEETIEEQEKKGMKYKTDGDRHFTEGGRVAEITIDLSQAPVQMAENNVNGPSDSVLSEMIKQLAQEKIYETTRCLQERFLEQKNAPDSWRTVRLVFLPKPDAAPKKERDKK